jgi:hypothetical protein
MYIFLFDHLMCKQICKKIGEYHLEKYAETKMSGKMKIHYDRHIGRDGNAENNVLDMWNISNKQQITPEM